MKKLLYLSLILLTACPALQTRSEINTKEGRIDSYSGPRTSVTEGTQQNMSPAETAAQEENLMEVVRRLNGAVEELSFKVNQLEQSGQSSAVENRLNLIEQRLLGLGESIIMLEQRMGGKVASAAVANPAAAQAKSAATSGPYEKGEQYFKGSNWKSAILEYNKYRDNFPKGKNYGEATYKIGVCFQELGMGSEAKSFYAEVIEKFPKTKTAQSAKYRLNQLKK